MRPLIKFWRSNGLKIVIFLDDGWGVNADFKRTNADAQFVFDTLQKAGFIINTEKSIFIPTQCLEWVGFIWDLSTGCLKIPERRIKNTLSCIELVKNSKFSVSARILARLSGKIISMTPVLGNVCLLQTKPFFKLIEMRRNWDSKIDISSCVEVVQMWENILKEPFQKDLFNDRLPEIFVYSDASATGGAGYIEHEGSVALKLFSEFEKQQSSTYRELLAIDFVLDSFRLKLSGKTVLWHTDSKNCVSIVEKGSMSPLLQDIALNIFTICAKNAISLKVVWIRREANVLADELSRVIDYDDYGITREFFQFIDDLYGPHTVDRFATEYNNKILRYNSLFWTPSTEAVDAFSVHWGSENNLIVPPIYLIPKALNHLLFCKGKGTLIAPYWPSSPFFPMIFGENASLQPFIYEVLVFKTAENIYEQGKFKQTIFGTAKFTSKVLVVRLHCDSEQ